MSQPCKYCGRTSQTPGHKTCDGCGAMVPSYTLRVPFSIGPVSQVPGGITYFENIPIRRCDLAVRMVWE